METNAAAALPTHKIEDAAFHIAAALMNFTLPRLTHMSRLYVSRPSVAADWLLEKGYVHHGKSVKGAKLTTRLTFNGRTSPERALYLTESGKEWANRQRQAFGEARDYKWPTRCFLAYNESVIK